MIYRFLIAAALLTLPVWAGLAQEAAVAAEDTPVLASTDPVAAKAAQLDAELARLEALRSELHAMDNAPLPEPVKPNSNSPLKTDSTVSAAELPPAPAPGSEAEFADALYRLGQYARARDIYKKLGDSKDLPEKKAAWIGFQLGNCARETGDYVAAIAAYENVMNASANDTWAREAEWWSGHLKWRLVWNETMKINAPASQQTP